jgi:phosphoribosylformylglycinamidine synthase
MNPLYGDLDPYHMAASAIDEAIRNCIAVGADPQRIALLDNFCWGDTDRPETLGSLVRAALGCHDTAVALGTPFISGKDSLNNQFTYQLNGRKRSISIPPSLLISALGQVDDVRQCVTMDLKEAGNLLYQVGRTRNELGGSHLGLVEALAGGRVPRVAPQEAKRTFVALSLAIRAGLVRACHDLSEGGLAVAAAEMAFAGGLGSWIRLAAAPRDISEDAPHELDAILLFSESNSRFLCEVRPEQRDQFERALAETAFAQIGEVVASPRLQIFSATAAKQATLAIDADIGRLKEAWQAPLRWR